MRTLRLSILAVMTALPMLALLGRGHSQASQQFVLRSTIAFTSTRDNPTLNPLLGAEIYLMNPDGTNVRRLTNNADGDAFAALSPDGKKIVFESNRNRGPMDPLNVGMLFVMDTDGSEPSALTHGSSATWSPDGKKIAFHASASGTGLPIKGDPGAATSDSDIFVLNVDDCIAAITAANQDPTKGDCRGLAPGLVKNVTNSPMAIDDDPDWSSDGTKIAHTSHSNTDNANNSVTAEIYVINADGTGSPARLTFNTEEERAPDWSPDGTRLSYACRKGTNGTFELCVMNADGSGQVRLTTNTVQDLTNSWSPDGTKIAVARALSPGIQQIFVMNADGTGVTQLTSSGSNLFPNWGMLRVKVP